MKWQAIVRFTFTLGLPLLAVSSCHDDPDPQPDLCKGQLANPLTFRFLESYGTPTPDTAYSKQDITFEGPGKPYTSYEWKIGTDDRAFTTQKFSLYFAEGNLGRFTVRLIARRPLNTACFAKDDGVDTLTKVLTLVPRATYRAPIYGEFEGSNADAPNQKFTVRVNTGPDYRHPYDPTATPYDYLHNLSGDCQSAYTDVGLTWRGIWFNFSGCLTEVGSGYLTTRDSIRIDYSQFESTQSSKRIDRLFWGKRVR